MAFLALLIGVVLVVSAIRDTHSQLLSAILTDVPAFAVWGAAIFGIALIGFIPGLRPVSRGLLALIVVVLILHNYQALIGAFTGLAQGKTATGGTGAGTGAGGGAGGSGGGLSTGDILSGINSFLNLDFSDLNASDNHGGGSSGDLGGEQVSI
jgi:hypothetical protein